MQCHAHFLLDLKFHFECVVPLIKCESWPTLPPPDQPPPTLPFAPPLGADVCAELGYSVDDASTQRAASRAPSSSDPRPHFLRYGVKTPLEAVPSGDLRVGLPLFGKAKVPKFHNPHPKCQQD